MGRETAKDMDMVLDSCRRIARESSESTYIRDREREGKTDIVVDRNIMGYN